MPLSLAAGAGQTFVGVGPLQTKEMDSASGRFRGGPKESVEVSRYSQLVPTKAVCLRSLGPKGERTCNNQETSDEGEHVPRQGRVGSALAFTSAGPRLITQA